MPYSTHSSNHATEHPENMSEVFSPRLEVYQGLCKNACRFRPKGWAFFTLDPLAHPHVLCINHGEDLTNPDDVLGLVLGAGSAFPGGADLHPPIAPEIVCTGMASAWLKLEEKTGSYDLSEPAWGRRSIFVPFLVVGFIELTQVVCTHDVSGRNCVSTPLAHTTSVLCISFFFLCWACCRCSMSGRASRLGQIAWSCFEPAARLDDFKIKSSAYTA